MSAPMSEERDGELNSSKLGTQKHWEEVYDRDLSNFKDNGDVGEVWFGYDSTERLVDWMENSELIHCESSVLDLGCGNGVTLIELSKIGL